MSFQSEQAKQTNLAAYDDTLSLSPITFEAVDVPTPYGMTHVLVAGRADAPAVVALHGKHCSSTMWLELSPVFTAKHRAYLVDSVGELGRSVATRMMHGRQDVLTWLDAVLDGLGLDRCALVGLSNGGFLGATYAMSRPERVERLMLLSPAGVISGIRFSWWRDALVLALSNNRAKFERFWFSHYVNSQPSPVRQKFDRQFLVGSEGMRMPVRDVFVHKYSRKRLSTLAMPVQCVFAAQDVIYDGARTAARAEKVLPSARVELLEDCGHMMTFDRLSAISALVGEFLRAESDVGPETAATGDDAL
jgi:pimeloyl-ACP methyl ester carboxylesterase